MRRYPDTIASSGCKSKAQKQNRVFFILDIISPTIDIRGGEVVPTIPSYSPFRILMRRRNIMALKTAKLIIRPRRCDLPKEVCQSRLMVIPPCVLVLAYRTTGFS